MSGLRNIVGRPDDVCAVITSGTTKIKTCGEERSSIELTPAEALGASVEVTFTTGKSLSSTVVLASTTGSFPDPPSPDDPDGPSGSGGNEKSYTGVIITVVVVVVIAAACITFIIFRKRPKSNTDLMRSPSSLTDRQRAERNGPVAQHRTLPPPRPTEL